MLDQDLKSIQECPTCASVNIVYSQLRDQIICRDCGLIFEPLAPEALKQKPVHIKHIKKVVVHKKVVKKKAVKKAVKKLVKKAAKKKKRK
ncbi:hypothetical protein HYV79_03030 [Candidatus Woesearchaeota archaeon]|nr:hypothetical protein [Candidatus Woesearchaeota archaeon]